MLINLKRKRQMNQRIPNTIHSKEFREQTVKQEAEDELSAGIELPFTQM